MSREGDTFISLFFFALFCQLIFFKNFQTILEVIIDINQVILTPCPAHSVLQKLPLGASKDEKFSCFHKACQTGFSPASDYLSDLQAKVHSFSWYIFQRGEYVMSLKCESQGLRCIKVIEIKASSNDLICICSISQPDLDLTIVNRYVLLKIKYFH